MPLNPRHRAGVRCLAPEIQDSDHFLPDTQRGIVDFRKADYVLGMAAFYELGDTLVIQQVFIEGYVRSVVRGSDVSASIRAAGFKVDEVARELVKYVQSGQLPESRNAGIFIQSASGDGARRAAPSGPP